MAVISWDDFEKIELRVGTIIGVEDFPQARRPAYKFILDLGKDLGIKKSSAQVTQLYTKDELIGKQVICVTNFPPKQIGPFISEVLITGFENEDNAIVLAIPEGKVPNGTRMR